MNGGDTLPYPTNVILEEAALNNAVALTYRASFDCNSKLTEMDEGKAPLDVSD